MVFGSFIVRIFLDKVNGCILLFIKRGNMLWMLLNNLVVRIIFCCIIIFFFVYLFKIIC